MIIEIAQVDVRPGTESEFEELTKKGVMYIRRAKGCHGVTVYRSIENPARFRFVVAWERVEDHTEGFRGSADHAEWIKLIDHCRIKTVVEHMNELTGF